MIGYRVLVQLLEEGYTVRTAVRTQAGSDRIKTLKPTQPYLDRIASIIVPDNTVPGAYDEAVQGVNYIIHVASPTPLTIPINADIENELIQPAMKGTISMLEAAEKLNEVQRIIITSSFVATIGFSARGSSKIFDGACCILP